MKKCRSDIVNLFSIFKTAGFFLLLFPLISQSAVITVPGDYSTIQGAIDAPTHGDEIIVSPGAYYENINFNGKNIVLRSTNPTSATVVSSTIINGGGSGSVVTFSGTELATCMLSGFTITNGNAQRGGGIRGYGTHATIQYNNIQFNLASAGTEEALGGGLYNCDGTIQYNYISGNQASGGYWGAFGGALCGCHGTIQYNHISGNSSDGFYTHWEFMPYTYSRFWSYWNNGYGGALAYCNGNVNGNIVRDNEANHAGGLYECNGTIYNNSISENSANASWSLSEFDWDILDYIYSYGYCGCCGGLYACDGTVQNNSITRNSSNDIAGGLYRCGGAIKNNIISRNSPGGLCECDGTVQYNTISGNSSGKGGGLYHCNGTIKNNTIRDNWAFWGGGLYECEGTILNNTISGNLATKTSDGSGGNGGGLHSCQGVIQSNTIAGNTGGDHGGGLYHCKGFIANCIIWENAASTTSVNQLHYCSTPIYSCIQHWTGGGKGNISSDPRFVDASGGDYHLLQDSPCIDAGNPYYLLEEHIVDIDGQCRIAGSSLDIGSDEFGSSLDSDGDLLADADEAAQGSDPNNADTDDDGLKDGVEMLRGTNPALHETASAIFIPANYLSIQQGLFLAFPSEVVTVWPGTYSENLRFPGRNIILQSINPLDEAIVNSTVIDGEGRYPVICFMGTENETAAVRGFTIRNGAALFYGGAICGNGSLATIDNNNILANSGLYVGGVYDCDGLIRNNVVSENSGTALRDCDGPILNNIITRNSRSGLCRCHGLVSNNIVSKNSYIGLADCDGTIQNNIISDNSGGGLDYCSGIIQNNVISGNRFGWGGGLHSCNGTIQNNILLGNSAYYGGGLHNCDGTIQNNTIWGNFADNYGGGLYDCNGTIRNCIIWENTAPSRAQIAGLTAQPTYSCIQDWTGGGIGNISRYPEFIDPGNGDLHLRPFSPCIDAGRNIPGLSQDFEGDTRPYDGTSEPRGDGSDFDIGADEYAGFGANPVAALITHYYSCILNRVPEQVAVPAWKGYFEYSLDFNVGAHFIAGDIGWRILLSAEYAGRNRSREEFIRDCYRAFLQRNASADEVTAWLNGSWSRDEAISIFINSNEFVNLIISLLPGHEGDAVRNFIATMYMGILERLVDGGAVEAWDAMFRDTSDKRGAAKGIARILFGSDEYTSKSPTNRDRVICLYRGLLGRFPNYDEISYWEEELNSGRATLEELIDIFCESEEFTARLIEFFGTAGSSASTETRDEIEHETESSPTPPQESPITEVPDWEYY